MNYTHASSGSARGLQQPKPWFVWYVLPSMSGWLVSH